MKVVEARALATVSAVWAAVTQIFIGGIVVHKISWARVAIIFSILLGLGIVDIALSL
mgnify:CR=1 FL=1